MQPLAERESEPYPLVLLQCGTCSLIQLSYQADPREMFPPGHPYATGNSSALRAHFAYLAAGLPAGTGPVADIGANDGTFLGYVARRVRIAVEPTGQARKAREKGIEHVYQEFFTSELAHRIRAEQGPADVVVATNVLAHVPDPHDFLEGVRVLLAGDGTFITENHDADSILRGLQIDTIYHEHLRYYSITSLSHLLGMHGLTVTETRRVSTHGGSFRVYARQQAPCISDFRLRACRVAEDLHALVAAVAKLGPVYGIGATTRATPLIHYAGLAQLVTCICEVASSEKIGMMMPGTAIPVVPDAALTEDQPPHALIFSHHIADSIIPKLRAAGYAGKFIIPLPEPVIL